MADREGGEKGGPSGTIRKGEGEGEAKGGENKKWENKFAFCIESNLESDETTRSERSRMRMDGYLTRLSVQSNDDDDGERLVTTNSRVIDDENTRKSQW